jgi:valyl-tRNA synthetase
LHLGHAIGTAIQDALCRYHMMNSVFTLWIPGTDHTGISTQVHVKTKIFLEIGKNRKEYSREYFLEQAMNGLPNMVTSSILRK